MHKKPYILLLLLVILLLGIMVFSKDDKTLKSYGNEFKIDTYVEFDTDKKDLLMQFVTKTVQ